MHLFVECPYSQEVWSLVAIRAGCLNLHPSHWLPEHDMEDWFCRLANQGTKRAHTLAILTLWCLWKQRNAVVFRDSKKSAQSLFTEIKDTCSCWISAGGKVLALPGSSMFSE